MTERLKRLLAKTGVAQGGALPISVELPVLGIPVLFESNDGVILDAVEEAFGVWRSLKRTPDLISPLQARARFLVCDGEEGPEAHVPLTYRMPVRERVVLTTPGSVGVADAGTGEVVAVVTRALVRDRAHFRYGVLEALTLALLTRFDRQPFHAAAVVRGRTALLLAGAAGVGKSTLTYAALRNGLKVLADDAVYLQADPRLRIWGIPGHLHLPEDAWRYFPELYGTVPTLKANGKLKIAIDGRAQGRMVEPPVVDDAGVCVVRRAKAAAGIESVPVGALEAALTAQLEPGFDVFADTVGTCIRTLAKRGGWFVNIAGPPPDLVPLLHQMFDRLDTRE